MTAADGDRPRWVGVSATFRTHGGLTDEGLRLLRGDEPAEPTTQVGWRWPAEDGSRFSNADADRLAGRRVDQFAIDFGGVVQEYGPGVILGARVIEEGAALWIMVETSAPTISSS